MKDLPLIYITAAEAIIKASNVIMEVYETDFKAILKEDGSPVTKADFKASKVIEEILLRTDIPILGEELEKPDYSVRSQWLENWCVDPLDGTRMFLARNDEFSVNIAHIVNGKSVFGLIGSPTEKTMLIGGPEFGVFHLDYDNLHSPEKWRPVVTTNYLNVPLTIICSRSYTHGSGFNYMQLLERNFGDLKYLRKGSALKFFDLAFGKADLYTRFAPTMEWDIAPGQAIIEALGGNVVTVKDNRPLRYNKEDLYNPRFIAKSKAFIAR